VAAGRGDGAAQGQGVPQTVTDLTRLKDFLRAGLAREVVVTDDAGEPVMIGKGKRRRPKTRIVVEDAEGLVIDLHAMRTTLGTKLAQAGVAPRLPSGSCGTATTARRSSTTRFSV
jgi:hypothetical protein